MYVVMKIVVINIYRLFSGKENNRYHCKVSPHICGQSNHT